MSGAAMTLSFDQQAHAEPAPPEAGGDGATIAYLTG